MKVIRRYRPDLWSGSPTDQLTSLRDEINRLFELPFGEWNRESELFNGWTPALDLYEDKDNLTVKAELPGAVGGKNPNALTGALVNTSLPPSFALNFSPSESFT